MSAESHFRVYMLRFLIHCAFKRIFMGYIEVIFLARSLPKLVISWRHQRFSDTDFACDVSLCLQLIWQKDHPPDAGIDFNGFGQSLGCEISNRDGSDYRSRSGPKPRLIHDPGPYCPRAVTSRSWCCLCCRDWTWQASSRKRRHTPTFHKGRSRPPDCRCRSPASRHRRR